MKQRLLLLPSYWSVVSKTLFSVLLIVLGSVSREPLVRSLGAAVVVGTFLVHYVYMMPLVAEMQDNKEVGGEFWQVLEVVRAATSI